MEDLVRGAQRGDPHAVDALLTELAPWVGRICASIALDRGADAMQETLVIVLRNLVTLREPAALRAWVRRIAVRQSLRMVRDDRLVLVAEPPEADPSEATAEVDLDTSIDVRDTLARLRPMQRAVLVLRHLEDLSERETAELLGVAVGTVKSGLHRAHRSFEDEWGPR